MWASWVVAAVALAAVTFMLRFLIALLHEGLPSFYSEVMPVRREPSKNLYRKAPGGADLNDDPCAVECNGGDHLEFLENERHVKPEYSSDLIVLDVRDVSTRMVWRPIDSNRGRIFGKHRL